MLSEGDDQISTMRVVTFIIVLSILIPSVIVAIRTNNPMTLTAEQVTIVLGALGIKTAQRAVEARESKTDKV